MENFKMENSKLLDHTEQKQEAYSISSSVFCVYVVENHLSLSQVSGFLTCRIFCLASQVLLSIISKACLVCCSPLQALFEEQVGSSLPLWLASCAVPWTHTLSWMSLAHFTFHKTSKDTNTWSKYHVIEDDNSKFQKQFFIPRKVESWKKSRVTQW